MRNLPAALIIFIVLPPLVAVFALAVQSRAGSSILPDARQWAILLRSLGLSGGVAGLSALVGGGLAFLIWEFPQKASRAALLFFLGVLFIPPYIQALAWTLMLGKGGLLFFLRPIVGTPVGLLWCVFLMTLIYIPLPLLLTWVGLSGMNEEVFMAARLVGPSRSIFRRILLPLAKPYLLASAALVFLLVFVDYSVPSQLSVNTFPVEVFIAYTADLSAKDALKGLLPMLLIGPAALWMCFQWFKNRPYAQTQRGRVQWGDTPPWKALLIVGPFILLQGILPLAQLAASSLPLSNLWKATTGAAHSILHSLLYALGASLGAMALAAIILRRGIWGGKGSAFDSFARGIALLPISIPGTALGIGILCLADFSFLRPLLRTPAALLLGYIILYLPYTFVILSAFIRRIPEDLFLASAQVSAPAARKVWKIHLPLLFPGLLCTGGLLTALILRELGLTVMVIAPGVESLAVRVDSFIHYGAGPIVCALALIQAALGLGICALALRFSRGADA